MAEDKDSEQICNILLVLNYSSPLFHPPFKRVRRRRGEERKKEKEAAEEEKEEEKKANICSATFQSAALF